jgi:hypothetical protein
MIRLYCAALILLGFPCRLIAQASTAFVFPGDRIRIHRSGSPEKENETARFVASRGDTLIVQLRSGLDTERVVGRVTAVSIGRRHLAGRGALTGLLIGAGGGAAAGYIWPGNCANVFGGTNGPSRTCAGEVATDMSILFGLAGLIVGTTVGAIATTDRWADVDARGPAPARVSLHGSVTGDRHREAHLGLTITR